MAAGRNSAGGSGAQQAAEGPGEQQRAGAGLLALAGDVDDRDLEPVAVRGAAATTKSPAKGVPPGGAQRRLGVPAVGQGRDAALR